MRILQICELGNIWEPFLGDESDLADTVASCRNSVDWTDSQKITAASAGIIIDAYTGPDGWPVGTLVGFSDWLGEGVFEGDEKDGTVEAIIEEAKARELEAGDDLGFVRLYAEHCSSAGSTVPDRGDEDQNTCDDYFTLDHKTAVEWFCLPYTAQNAFKTKCGKNALEELAYA